MLIDCFSQLVQYVRIYGKPPFTWFGSIFILIGVLQEGIDHVLNLQTRQKDITFHRIISNIVLFIEVNCHVLIPFSVMLLSVL